MPLPPRLLSGDEELGKKDDDHRRGSRTPVGLAWHYRRIPHGLHRRTLKRLAWAILAFVVLYYFFKNMPTDLENPRQRPNYGFPAGPNAPPPKFALAGQGRIVESAAHDFNGPIKFFHLASTLHAVSKTRGSELINHNVLFAAASLKSAARLLPVACEMGIRERNYVHFALIGRDDISMDILRSVNGITKECKIIFHDGRPDFSLQSTDFRMEVAASAAFNHINTFIHPQATFVDASGEEEIWFLKGIKDRAVAAGRTVIDLPENAEQSLMWITMLDSSSLSAWNSITIDIVVHAHSSSSGSLMRLLNSLKNADFFSSAPPRLTIELPHTIDEPSRRYLSRFKWPPTPQNIGSLLTLHHRIPQHGLSAEENSIRMLESFWPSDPSTSHVLVLSPQIELSPLFFHYLKYSLLEYKYSFSKADPQQNVIAISLDIPSTYLNDSTSFIPPLGNVSQRSSVVAKGITPFLWQAPNSNAALYFGEKWVELHDFIAQTLSLEHTSSTTPQKKEVSKTYPSWLEHVLKLARARGYCTIYPNFEDADSLATLHNDLYQPPEEYEGEIEAEPAEGELTADPAMHLSLKHMETPLITKSLLSMLPFKGELPKMTDMPLLSWDGNPTTIVDLEQYAVQYSSVFRIEIGGCGEDMPDKVREDFTAGDLFCLSDP
ncbi:hypothetical protein V8E51_015248 [Hyaloscypha variabilis]